MNIPKGKKIYFASDNHLGAPTIEASRPREKKFVAWLDSIKHDAAAIFLVGDLLKPLFQKDLQEHLVNLPKYQTPVFLFTFLLATMIYG